MDFTFNDDQFAFRDALEQFLGAEVTPDALRGFGETDIGLAPELWAKFAEQGVTGLSVPEAEGGLGFGDVDWALLAQVLGYHAIPDPLVDTAWVATGMLAGLPADSALRAEWLPRIADGSCRVAVGHPVNPWLADAAAADLLLLPETTPDGSALHALEPGNVKCTPLHSLGASRRLATVEWQPSDATRVTAAAAELWDETLDRGALATSAQLVGLAQRMLDVSVEYAKTRKQFGKPIGSFQAIKHHLADVVTRIEFAKPVLYRAAAALARHDPDRSRWVSQAKLACADAAWLAARQGIQVHGAMGYTWEVDLQVFMKRAWVLDAAWGDRGFHRARVGALLLDAQAAIGPGRTFATQLDQGH